MSRRLSQRHKPWSLVKVISEHLRSEWSFWKSTWSYPIKDILTRYLKLSSGILIISYPCFFQGALWSPHVGGNMEEVRFVMPRGWRSFEYWRCCAKCLSKNRVSWSKDKMSWFWTCLFLGGRCSIIVYMFGFVSRYGDQCVHYPRYKVYGRYELIYI